MSNFTIKNKKEIDLMRKAGKIAADVLANLVIMIKPGITTQSIDVEARILIKKAGCTPSFLNFNKFPAATCISLNNEVVHGIPDLRIIKNNDLISIDLGVNYQGYHSDTAITIGVGSITPEVMKLIITTKLALEKAIKIIKPGIHLGDVQQVIQNTIEKEGFGVIRDLAGHGIGKNLQEPPSIPNYGKAGTGLLLQEGMTLAIEPMVSMGDWKVKVLDDGWTVVTADNSLAAHFEHTIAITKNGCEILTKI